MTFLLEKTEPYGMTNPAGADIFPVRALQAMADVNVAKN